jgi:hypothetical protein
MAPMGAKGRGRTSGTGLSESGEAGSFPKL